MTPARDNHQCTRIAAEPILSGLSKAFGRKMNLKSLNRRQQTGEWDQRGTIAVITALGLLALLGMGGLVLDLGHLYVVKSELQRAADAGAAAGARALFPYPSSHATLPLAPDCGAALTRGQATCRANLVDGAAAVVADIQTGFWNWQAGQFVPGCSASPFSNALSLTTRRDNLSLTVIGALGLGPVNLQARAVAVMDWVGGLEEGVAFVLALDKNHAQKGDVYIALNPDPMDAGGWYAKAPQKPNNSLINGYLNNPNTVPALKQGDTINLNNGVWENVLATLAAGWIGKTVWLPVVDTQKYNQSAPVEGFTAFAINEINTQGHQYIRGNALPLGDVPEKMSDPGGDKFGLLSAPRLVK